MVFHSVIDTEESYSNILGHELACGRLPERSCDQAINLKGLNGCFSWVNIYVASFLTPVFRNVVASRFSVFSFTFSMYD